MHHVTIDEGAAPRAGFGSIEADLLGAAKAYSTHTQPRTLSRRACRAGDAGGASERCCGSVSASSSSPESMSADPSACGWTAEG